MADGSSRERLLKEEEKSEYHENCPGCRIERVRNTQLGIPYKLFFYVWLISLCAALPISSLYPFLYFMVKDFHIASREEDISYYAGYVGSAFMFGRALTSVLWGMVADKYGRKPVAMIGLASTVIFNTLFGLSTNFWMAISMRFVLGSLVGILGPIKAYSLEVCRKEHQALAMSVMSTSWGIGLVIGPAIGGYFAQPAEKFPSIFSKESIFGRFPYFLPCFLISFVALCVLVAACWLPETLHKHNKKSEEVHKSYEALEESRKECDVNEESEKPARQSLLRNWPLMSSIIVYCVFQLHDMAYIEIFSFWATSPRKFGGLSYSTAHVGEVLGVSGVGLLIFQLFLYPPVERTFGPINVSRAGAVLTILLLTTYPFLAKLSGIGLTILVNIASLSKNVLSVSITTGLFLLQNRAVTQEQRGAANGIALASMSLFKTIGPAAGGLLFSWAEKRQHAWFLPGQHMVFFVLNLVEALGLLLTLKPFLAFSDDR